MLYRKFTNIPSNKNNAFIESLSRIRIIKVLVYSEKGRSESALLIRFEFRR